MLLLNHFLSRLIQAGDLTVMDCAGRRHRHHGSPLPGIPPVTIRLADRRLEWQLALRPSLIAGEAYMDGRLEVIEGGLRDFLALTCLNLDRFDRSWSPGNALKGVPRLIHNHNAVGRSARNVAHHYDLSDRLYALFLDDDRQYSCAYFTHPQASLDQAQIAKKHHIAAKLLLAPGQRVLDIGCGWGGMALTLATLADIEVTGITLSREQLAVAKRRAAEAGLSDRVRFELADYRHVRGSFDRVVSVGMFEHVGTAHYHTFFKRMRALLEPGGVALLHSIMRSTGPGATNPWVRRYIFPGGYIPALSEVLPAVEDSGLMITDVEILRRHYADTLAHWHARFQAHRTEIARLYDERFCRMWEFYLLGSEMAFRHQGHRVFQLQLARDAESVPVVRDYIVDTERAWEFSPLSPLSTGQMTGTTGEMTGAVRRSI